MEHGLTIEREKVNFKKGNWIKAVNCLKPGLIAHVAEFLKTGKENFSLLQFVYLIRLFSVEVKERRLKRKMHCL